MTFEELLARDGVLVYRTKGVSMEPMLRQNRDLVTIRVPASPLKKYDVACYRRGTDHVLHRVVGVTEEGYLIRGDNTYRLERVPFDAVVGVLTDFQRKGRDHRVTEPLYGLYARLWNAVYPLRALYVRARRAAARFVRGRRG